MTRKSLRRDLIMNWQIYLMFLPILVYFIIFNYIPLTGLVMAFEEFSPVKGIFGSPWVGLAQFKSFFGSYYFIRLLRNTFLLSFYDLIFGFPAPIIFALLLNEVKGGAFKKTVQTMSYMPHFISMVVICSIVTQFTNSNGAVTQIVVALGGTRRNLLGDPSAFRSIFVGSGIWQGIGYGSIIYLAALSGVDQELYEAATIDGAGRLRQTWHITLPGIAPTIIIMLILRMGSLFAVGFEKIILLYKPITYDTADVISSFVYRRGLIDNDYSFSTAVGLFNSLVNTFMLCCANFISRKYSETSLF